MSEKLLALNTHKEEENKIHSNVIINYIIIFIVTVQLVSFADVKQKEPDGRPF